MNDEDNYVRGWDIRNAVEQILLRERPSPLQEALRCVHNACVPVQRLVGPHLQIKSRLRREKILGCCELLIQPVREIRAEIRQSANVYGRWISHCPLDCLPVSLSNAGPD